MAGETEEKPSGLTVDTLRLLLDGQLREADRRYEQRFAASERAVAAAFAAAKEATEKAATAAEKRFEAVNEFRAALGDQQRTLVTRNEAESQHKAINDRIDELVKKLDTLTDRFNQFDGRTSGTLDARTLTISGVLILISLAGVITAIVVALSH